MEFVTYEQDGFVGVVTINRPKALNALNSEVLKEIEATFDAIDLRQETMYSARSKHSLFQLSQQSMDSL